VKRTRRATNSSTTPVALEGVLWLSARLCSSFFFVTPRFFKHYGGRVSELEAKYLLFLVFAMGGLAVWSGSEAVLPAYVIGMVLAGTVGKDHVLIRRLRTLTFVLFTPFYFIRAGSFVSAPALVAAPIVFLVLFGAKMLSKIVGLSSSPLPRREAPKTEDMESDANRLPGKLTWSGKRRLEPAAQAANERVLALPVRPSLNSGRLEGRPRNQLARRDSFAQKRFYAGA